ncbi:MAG: DUF58 domain-containing protein [Armatimonadetes bacterium]|nr:DUF58 domain-containing protein [Armatimonadota bacterium]
MQTRLLEPEFLRQLEQLSLVAKRVFAGRLKGERRSVKRGASVEFADYRNYALGDDPRYIDWNTYARLERLFLKLFMEEEDLHVYVLLDGSRSMTFGTPSKFDYARRVAAALGYIGLCGYDRVGAALLGESMREYLAPLRGRPSVFRFFRFLEEAQADGGTALGAALQEWALRARRTGIAILVSDFLDPQWEAGIKALALRKYQLAVIHVLDRSEVEPDLVGDLKLIDAETGEEREISVSGVLLRDYRRALDHFCGSLQAACRKYGADYLRATTDVPFEDLVLRWLRSRGLVK